MGWRKRYKVHPAADVYPMLSDDELKALGEDIKQNGLRDPVTFWRHDEYMAIDLPVTGYLIDGRNRLEAMERAGLDIREALGVSERFTDHWYDQQTDRIQYLHDICGDAGPNHVSAFLVSKNIRRRHLTKTDQVRLIAATYDAAREAETALAPKQRPRNKPPHVEEVSKGGRGKVNETKAAVMAIAKEQGISKATVERGLRETPPPQPKPKPKPMTDAWDAIKKLSLNEKRTLLKQLTKHLEACEAEKKTAR